MDDIEINDDGVYSSEEEESYDEFEEEELEEVLEENGIDLEQTFALDETEAIKNIPPIVKFNEYTEIMKKADMDIDSYQSDLYMTKYEYTRLRGVRLQQLAAGSPPFVVLPAHVSTIEEIFDLEFEQKKLPFIIKRPMPNGDYECVKIKNLLYLPNLTSSSSNK